MADLPMVAVGELLPDHPDRDNPGLLKAENCLPAINSYQPIRALVANRDPIAGRCRGAGPVTLQDGTLMNFAGDNTTLYKLDAGAYVDAGQTYQLQDRFFWTFFEFNGYAFALGGYQTLQQFDPLNGFEDVVPTQDDPPQALYGDVVRGFIMTGNQSLNPQEVVWSAIDDHTRWVDADGDTTIAAQAGRQILQDAGPITQVCGGEYGIIFCERGIFRANYEGSPLVFSFNTVAPGKGTVAPGSVMAVGEQIYYLDVDGFYVFNGSSSRPIGSTKMNQTFLEDLNTDMPQSIDSVADIENTTIYWSYVSESSSYGDVPDKIMAYNWSIDKFAGPIHMPTECFVYSLNPGILPDIDAIGSEKADDYPDTLSDASEFRGGGRYTLAAFNTDHAHSTPTGTVLEALIESGEYSLNPHGYAMMSGVRPVVEGERPDIRVAVGRRDQTFGDVTWTADNVPNARTQLVNTRSNSRYQRFRMRVKGDYNKIVGAEAELVGTGRQ